VLGVGDSATTDAESIDASVVNFVPAARVGANEPNMHAPTITITSGTQNASARPAAARIVTTSD
jgi:hypothetical protein